MQLIGLLHSR